MQTTQIVWLVLLIVFLVLEGVTAAVVSIWFAIGALVSLLVSLIFPGAIVLQCVLFVLASAIAIVAFRPFVRKVILTKKVATNADAAIGKHCQIISEVQPNRFGRVKLDGQDWTAKSDYVMPVGSWGIVVAIEGVKLVVVPQMQEAPLGQGSEPPN